MKLYNVTFDLTDESKCLCPYVPYTASDDEDQLTERICFADTVEHCISAIGSSRRDLREGALLVVRSVDADYLDKSKLVTPYELYDTGSVPDALETNEWWYLDKIFVERDVYRIISFDFEHALAFTCIGKCDLDYLIDKHDPGNFMMYGESVEQAYYRVVGKMQDERRYNESDSFEDEVAALPWAQKIKITNLVMEKVS